MLDGMSDKDARKQINLRLTDELNELVDELRRQTKPLPSASEILRQALMEKAERDLKRKDARR